MAARLDQSVIELNILGSPAGVVDQSVVEIVVLPAVIPPPTPGAGIPLNVGMGGGSDPCVAVQCAREPVRMAPFYRIPKTKPTDQSRMQSVYFRHGRGH